MAILLLYPALHEYSEVNDAWWPEQVAYWIREEKLPPELLPTAHYLRENFSEQVLARCRNIRNYFQTDQEQARRGLLQEAFLSYCEIRLIRLIQCLTHSLKGQSPGIIRDNLNRELKRQQNQLSRLSRFNDYAGAVR